MNETQETKFKNLLGLAQRANKIVSGTFKVDEAIKHGKAKLIIVAEDTSESSINDYTKMAELKNIPMIKALTKETLGNSLGKEYRSVAAVLDAGFCKAIHKLFNENG